MEIISQTMMKHPSVSTFLALLLLLAVHVHVGSAFLPTTPRTTAIKRTSTSSSLSSSLPSEFNKALTSVQDTVTKVCNVAMSTDDDDDSQQQQLVATTKIRKGDVIVNMPYDDLFSLTPTLALDVVYKSILPDGYDAWTGDAGLIALLLLNEVAHLADNGKGIPSIKRPTAVSNFVSNWIETLVQADMSHHPLLWSENDQEVLQTSSTTKIYRLLDDIEEDVTWLTERVWDLDRDQKFPKEVTIAGSKKVPCFSLEGYKWAMAVVSSHAVYLDGQLRLLPLLNQIPHSPRALEVEGGTMGTFGTTKGAVLRANKDYNKGDAVYLNHGPKSPADYCLEHGLFPTSSFFDVSELSFNVDADDTFYDDKMDVLEFETYDLAPMDPTQSFTIGSQSDGEPDPAMIQFVRFCKLSGQDAFLLESIFRKEVWEFMGLPVSEANELKVVNTIVDACAAALEEFKNHKVEEGDGPEMCRLLQESETKALTKTLEYLKREREALDLKEYYQERRLKNLGLDSEWSLEEDESLERLPGNANYDW